MNIVFRHYFSLDEISISGEPSVRFIRLLDKCVSILLPNVPNKLDVKVDGKPVDGVILINLKSVISWFPRSPIKDPIQYVIHFFNKAVIHELIHFHALEWNENMVTQAVATLMKEASK